MFKLFNILLVVMQEPATYIFNRFSEMTWEDELLLEKYKFKCLGTYYNCVCLKTLSYDTSKMK